MRAEGRMAVFGLAAKGQRMLIKILVEAVLLRRPSLKA